VISADYSIEIALLFEKARNGDKLAENRLAELLMPELRRIASVYLGRDFRGDSMRIGDLINEIYLILMKCGEAADVYRPLRAVAQH
jgi:hypothetical protein